MTVTPIVLPPTVIGSNRVPDSAGGIEVMMGSSCGDAEVGLEERSDDRSTRYVGSVKIDENERGGGKTEDESIRSGRG